MRTLLRNLLAGVATIAAVAGGLVVLAAVLVTATPFGARFALERGAELVPGRVEIGALEGSFWTGLVLEDVRYESETLTAELERLIVEPVLPALASGRVVLRRLAAENGIVRLAETAAEPQSPPRAERAEPLPLPDLPDYVAIDELRLSDLRVEGLGVPLAIEHAAGALADGELDLERVEIAAAEPLPFSASLAMRVTSRQVTGAVTGNVALPDDASPAGAAAAPDRAARPDEPSTRDEVAAPDGATAAGAAADANRISFDAEFELVSGPAAGDAPWRAVVEWTELAWPGAGVRSPGGRLAAAPGEPDGTTMAIELEARLAGEALPTTAELTGTAALTPGTLDLTALRLEALGGTAWATGALDLTASSGHLRLVFDGIDPSLVDERLEGRLEGQLDAALATDPGLRVGAGGTIGGQLGGRPLDGRFAGSYADETLTIEQARVELEGSAVVLDGSVAPETTDVRFSARLPRLSDWYPPASGSLEASGTIMGPTENPAVDAELEASNLGLEDASVPPLETLTAAIEGRLASHELSLDASSELGRVSFTLEQGYANERLRGTLLDSVLAPAQAGVWNLEAPAEYRIAGAEDIALERACYLGPEDGRLCLAAMDGELAVDAGDLPNALAEPWLPAGLAIQGTTDVELTIALTGPLRGSVTIEEQSLRIGIESAGAAQASPGRAATGTSARDTTAAEAANEGGNAAAPASESAATDGALAESGFMELLDLADLTLSATIGPEGLEAEIGGAPEALAETISGRVTLSPLSMQGRLDGRIVANVADVSVIGAFVEGVEDLEGAVEARLTLTGTPEAPEIMGRIVASELSAELPPLGITVGDGRFTAEVDGLEEVAFEGELCSMGCATLAGRLSLPAGAPWRAELSIEGQRVEVANLPDLRAVVTPDLAVAATPEAVRVTGAAAVAEAMIEVADLPRTAVRPVPETVIYGREPVAEEEENALPMPLLVDVEARLGDVRFEGFGLTAELDGALDVEHTADGRWLVQGQARIEEGIFAAYGQELTIEQGLLIFSGPPENPALDIRATRVVDGVEVGLEITGTASNPRSRVFAAGGLSESEALARLVTGRSLEGTGEAADPEALERAAVGLGIRRALPALGRVGESLGLDELGVEAPGAEEGALVAGKRLSNDVYLRYKHGLFDEFSGLELIYRITERFRLRTETGTAQAIDVIYEVERAGAEQEDDIAEAFDEPPASDAEDVTAPADPAAPAD